MNFINYTFIDMNKTLLTFISSSFTVWTMQAQPPEGAGPNLVPNPSFEEVQGKRPSDDEDGAKSFQYNMVHWRSPTRGTPDLKFALPHEISAAARDGLKKDVPHTGYKMVAILTHNPKSERSDTYREYIQAKLISPTKKGSKYYYEFWVCKTVRAKYVSNNIGLVLSPTMISEDSWEPLTDIEPDINVSEVMNKDGRQWVKYSGTLISANRSEFILLGNFFNNEKTTMVDAQDGGDFDNAYYLIDDVALYEMDYKPEPPPAAMVVEEELEVGKTIELDHVYFETAKWDLLTESFEQLDQVVKLLEDHPNMEIEIHGHTDSRGTDDDNMKLSKNRTKSVYEYLISKGIAEARLGYKGFGETTPRDDNDTSEGRQRNRRVEFVITKLGANNTTIKYNDNVKPYTDNE